MVIGYALAIANGVSAQAASATVNANANANYNRGSSVRLALQGRYDAINVIGPSIFGDNAPDYSLVPLMTPGVRLINDRLFLGLGFGFTGYSADSGNVENSRSAVSFCPTAFYDLISEPGAALSLGGWLSIASVSDSETCVGDNCSDAGDGELGWGLNLAAGLRGKLMPGLALGGEFGWGFLSVSNNTDVFFHGVFGNILLEASVGL